MNLDVNYEKCEQVRYEEIAHWNNELNLLFEYKYAIEEGLELINSGAVEQMLIEEIVENIIFRPFLIQFKTMILKCLNILK